MEDAMPETEVANIPRFQDSKRCRETQREVREAQERQDLRKRYARDQETPSWVSIADLGLPWLRNIEWLYWLDDLINCEPSRTKNGQGEPRSAGESPKRSGDGALQT